MELNFLLFFLAAFLCVSKAVDTTLHDGATGSDVVQAVIAKLDASRIAFRDDHRLLRRLAFVETADGADSGSSTTRGLWGLDKDKLDLVLSAIELAELRIVIEAVFRIDWRAVIV